VLCRHSSCLLPSDVASGPVVSGGDMAVMPRRRLLLLPSDIGEKRNPRLAFRVREGRCRSGAMVVCHVGNVANVVGGRRILTVTTRF
jgi:hypothetical protein